jgi:hypothetical protein
MQHGDARWGIRLTAAVAALALLAVGACDDDDQREWRTVDAGHDAPADMSDDVGVDVPPETMSETGAESSAEGPREAGTDVADAEVGDTPLPALAGILSHERRGIGDAGTDLELVNIDLDAWSISIQGTGAADQTSPLAHGDRDKVTAFLREPGVWAALTSTVPCQTDGAGGGESRLVGFQLPGQFRRAKAIESCRDRAYTGFLSLWIELRNRYFGAEVCSPTFVPPPSWQPPFRCSRGLANGGCDDVLVRPTCQDGRWVCPANQVPSHLCVCFLPFGCRDGGIH